MWCPAPLQPSPVNVDGWQRAAAGRDNSCRHWTGKQNIQPSLEEWGERVGSFTPAEVRPLKSTTNPCQTETPLHIFSQASDGTLIKKQIGPIKKVAVIGLCFWQWLLLYRGFCFFLVSHKKTFRIKGQISTKWLLGSHLNRNYPLQKLLSTNSDHHASLTAAATSFWTNTSEDFRTSSDPFTLASSNIVNPLKVNPFQEFPIVQTQTSWRKPVVKNSETQDSCQTSYNEA